MDAQWLNTQFQFQPDKSKAELARALGLEPPAVSKILNGTRQIKAHEYIRMREFFGMPADGGRAVSGTQSGYVVKPLDKEETLSDSADSHSSQWISPDSVIKPHTNTPSENIKSFRVADNMMAPDFHRDEHVLVDLSNTHPSPPGVFILSDGYNYMLRHCEIVPGSQPLHINVTASSASFRAQKLALSEIKIIGRVLAKLQWL